MRVGGTNGEQKTCSRGHAYRGNGPCPVCWPGRRQALRRGDPGRQKRTYRIRTRVWLYPGSAAWHFVTIPKKESVDIKKRFGKRARGWGSLPVSVTVGETTWRTSIFPDRTSGAYLLPIKSEARKRERIIAGQTIVLFLEVQP